MSERKLTEQLKAIKHERAGGAPDAAWLASTRETLLMQVKNTVSGKPRAPSPKIQGWLALARFIMPEHIGRLVAVPALALLLIVSANFGASALVAAAKDTLPGDSLYAAKLAAERLTVRFASGEVRAEHRLEIAGRRLEEMARLAAGTTSKKEEKLALVADHFSTTMAELRADLVKLGASDDAAAAVRVALRVDAAADGYLRLFHRNGLYERPNLRFAVLSLDQASVSALELLVEKRDADPEALPEARLTSAVGKSIETFASHVANKGDGPSVLKAKEKVDEAKELLSAGDFKAAVRKVAEWLAEASATSVAEIPAAETSATSTEE